MRVQNNFSGPAITCLMRVFEELDRLDRALQHGTFNTNEILHSVSDLRGQVRAILDWNASVPLDGAPLQTPFANGGTGCWDALNAAVQTYRRYADSGSEPDRWGR